MKVLIDMNISPDWVSVFLENGIEAIHWSTVGKSDAKDSVIFDWSRLNNYIILTHDLDFGTILAFNQLNKPSVVILRATDLGSYFVSKVIRIFKQYEQVLDQGSLIIYDSQKERVRILPLSI